MPPLIAIPEPVSNRADYKQRALPQYIEAIEQAGAKARIILLSAPLTEASHAMAECDAVLLPGSPADVDPHKYQAAPDPHTAPADQVRDVVDAALLRDCYEHRKPVLGICYGLQSLNVWRAGSLVQHIESPVNHEAGRTVLRAHKVEVVPFSRLAAILSSGGQTSAPVADSGIRAEVNSSHHQAAGDIGDGLRAVAACPDDGVVEAIEGTAPDHFVLAVQWHPERTVESEESSRAIFRSFVQAAAASNHH